MLVYVSDFAVQAPFLNRQHLLDALFTPLDLAMAPGFSTFAGGCACGERALNCSTRERRTDSVEDGAESRKGE